MPLNYLPFRPLPVESNTSSPPMKTASAARLHPLAQNPSNRAWALVLGMLTILSLPLEAATLRPAQIGLQSDKNIYHDGWIDFNKNGRKDVFEDPSKEIEQRISDLLSQMNVDEKTCQLATLYGYRRVLKDPLPTADWKNQIWRDGIANIDEMHNGVGKSGDEDNPHIATPEATVRALNEIQRWFIEETRLGIPVEYTNEGVRGANYRKTVNFPADIALGASWNPELLSAVGEVVAKESKVIGYRNVYAPLLDLARDPRWGRVVECYGEEPYHVGTLGLRMIKAIRGHGRLRNILRSTASPRAGATAMRGPIPMSRRVRWRCFISSRGSARSRREGSLE